MQKTSDNKLIKVNDFTVKYPPTKILFTPASHPKKDVVLTVGDYLRMWPLTEKLDGKRENEPLVYQLDNSSIFSPITSADWSIDDIDTVACCSVNRQITLWDLESQKPKIQLIAHEKEIFDISFHRPSTFVTSSADGSVRLFDLRSINKSQPLYETSVPLLRTRGCICDRNYLATFGLGKSEIIILDARKPGTLLQTLEGEHKKPVSGIEWSPTAYQHLCSVGEDGSTIIWDTRKGDPIFEHLGALPIHNVAWDTREIGTIATTTMKGVDHLTLELPK